MRNPLPAISPPPVYLFFQRFIHDSCVTGDSSIEFEFKKSYRDCYRRIILKGKKASNRYFAFCFFFFSSNTIVSAPKVLKVARYTVPRERVQSFPLCCSWLTFTDCYTARPRHRRYTFPLMRSFFRQREHSVLLSPNHFSGRLVRPNLDRNTKVLRRERRKGRNVVVRGR